MEVMHCINNTNYLPVGCGAAGGAAMTATVDYFKDVIGREQHVGELRIESLPALSIEWQKYGRLTGISLIRLKENPQAVSYAAYFGAGELTLRDMFPAFGHLAFLVGMSMNPSLPTVRFSTDKRPMVISYSTAGADPTNPIVAAEICLAEALFCG